MKFSRNYPNPFVDSTTIEYSLPNTSKVGLDILNAKGELVYRMVTHTQTAGTKSLVWNGKNILGEKLPSGRYFYIIKVDGLYEISSEMMIENEVNETVMLRGVVARNA
ncbi:MAG: FlgD immunoglobulin-like domain containing protein [Bacteroidota bacterium]